jgi:hypothetical protein
MKSTPNLKAIMHQHSFFGSRSKQKTVSIQSVLMLMLSTTNNFSGFSADKEQTLLKKVSLNSMPNKGIDVCGL